MGGLQACYITSGLRPTGGLQVTGRIGSIQLPMSQSLQKLVCNEFFQGSETCCQRPPLSIRRFWQQDTYLLLLPELFLCQPSLLTSSLLLSLCKLHLTASGRASGIV